MPDAETMKAYLRFEAKNAFVLQETDLKKIWTSLDGEHKVVDATMECSDGVVFKKCNLTNLLEYENSTRSEVASIVISSYCSKTQDVNSVYLGGSQTKPLSFMLQGDVAEMSNIRNKLLDVFEGMRPWYDLIARFDFAYVVFGMVTLAMIYVSFAPSVKVQEQVPTSEILYKVGATAVIAALVIGFGLVISWTRRKWFPVSVFAIGQGLKRHDLAEKVRWGVCISLAVSILGSFLFKPFA